MTDRDPVPTVPVPHTPTGPDSTAHNDSPPDTAPPDAAARSAALGDVDAGTLIAGKYRLAEKLGEGGMGAVWRADQTHPVRRPVAVKLIRGGAGSAAAVARFEAERQALALMDHPHVAKVFDAGTTDAGDPFFVMEVVPGVPLTRFCDDRRLDLRHRLELFIQVCQAVQHAHQRGIIHRDLKPGNILVEDRDGKPVPKVIDFGLAKALGGVALTDQPDQTGYGAVMGTPLYMAPEQAGGDPADVDTRADVYALGVMLYELLTGTTPIERERLAGMDVIELLQAIQKEEPPTPSSRLTTTVSGKAEWVPPVPPKRVRGELDWITMKALAKERDRRYATAAALGEDVGRYLRDEPVVAGPSSDWYRMRKFVTRNRGPVAAVVILLTTLVGGVVGTTVGMLQARAASKEAQQRSVWAENANEILVSAFRDLDPRAEEKGGPPLRTQLGERLDKAATLLEEEVVGDPLTMARLQNDLGVAQLHLGYSPRAERLFARAIETRRERLSPDHPDTLTSYGNLGLAYLALGRAADAAEQLEPTLRLSEAKLGPDHPLTLITRHNLAGAYLALGRAADAAEQLEPTLRLRETELGPDHPDTLVSRNNLAEAYLALGRASDAARLHEETLKLLEAKLGSDHPQTLISRNNLAEVYRDSGRAADAARLHGQTLKMSEAKLGPDHPETLKYRNNLALAYLGLGRAADAAKEFEPTLKLRETKLGPDHPETLKSRNNLALAYLALSRTADAARLHEQTLKMYEAKLGPDHPDTLTSRYNLAGAYYDLGRVADAARLFEQTLKLREAKLGPDHPHTMMSRNNLAAAYRALGRATDAARLLEQNLNLREAKLGPGHPDTMMSRRNLTNTYDAIGLNLLQQRKWADAEPVVRECLTIREKAQPEVWNTFNTRSMLGGALFGQGKHADAEPLLLAGYAGLKQRAATIPPAGRPRLREAGERLAQLYDATHRPAEAAKVRAELPRELAPPPRPAKP